MGTFDDQVDMVSGAVEMIAQGLPAPMADQKKLQVPKSQWE